VGFLGSSLRAEPINPAAGAFFFGYKNQTRHQTSYNTGVSMTEKLVTYKMTSIINHTYLCYFIFSEKKSANMFLAAFK
jgi:hypothetical protein